MGSTFDASASGMVAAVAAGVSFDSACRSADVNVNTARSWLASGRRDAAGRYGEFAALVDAARGERRAAEGALADGSAVTLAEAEAVLSAAVRKGSIPALKLWFDRHGDAGGGGDDPFDEFDAAR